jgi:hypothetical protein
LIQDNISNLSNRPKILFLFVIFIKMCEVGGLAAWRPGGVKLAAWRPNGLAA